MYELPPPDELGKLPPAEELPPPCEPPELEPPPPPALCCANPAVENRTNTTKANLKCRTNHLANCSLEAHDHSIHSPFRLSTKYLEVGA